MNAGLHHSAVALATEHSSTAGRKLGKVHSEAKAKAAAINGQKGGRPMGSKLHGNGDNTMSQGMKYYNTPSHAHNLAMNAMKKNMQPLNLSPQNLPSSPVGRMPL